MRPGRVRPGYNVDEAKKIFLDEASMRPGRVRPGYRSFSCLAACANVRFNEAGARPPRIPSPSRQWFKLDQTASMRPGRVRPGYGFISMMGYNDIPASMRPGRVRPGYAEEQIFDGVSCKVELQ